MMGKFVPTLKLMHNYCHLLRASWVCTLLLFFAITAITSRPMQASGQSLATAPAEAGLRSALRFESASKKDTLRALIVFARFQDDHYPGDPGVFHRQWPLFDDPHALPPFARHLISTEPDPPYPDSSITAYFHQQSLGQFVLYGEVYDSVLTSLKPEATYHQPQGGYGDLTKELLDRIDAAGFDFSRFDANEDGLIDHIFVILRGDSQRDNKRFVWTGASCLDGRCSGTMAGGGPNPREPIYYDGKRLDWDLSGSYLIHRTAGNIDPLTYHVRLMAHELGHDLWAEHFVHIPSNERNDVPLKHNRGRGRDCVAYLLMAGSGGAQDCAGSQTIAAYERELLGWIDCTTLKQSQKGIRIGDLYSTSDCYKIELDHDRRSRRIYLSNLQRVGYFDRYLRTGSTNQFEIGLLRTTGLLPMLVDGKGVDILPADNTMQIANDNAAYEGDLWGPGTKVQLTPWTRPNINGFTEYPGNYEPSWVAIDRIRPDNVDPHTLLLDFYEDFRLRPVIREDSWMGPHLNGYAFKSTLAVTNQRTLHIQTAITIESALVLHAGSTVVIAEGAHVRMAPRSHLWLKNGTTLIVKGTLTLDGILSRMASSQLIIEGSGLINSNVLD